MPSQPRYLLVGHWGKFNPVLHAEIGRLLDPDSVLYSPLEFYEDSANWLGPKNYHWNAAGHEKLARMLFGLLRSRGLLPMLALTPDADGVRVSTIHAAKGLEADGVLLLDAHHLQTRADAEARRLLYIAMTRARHDLAISYFRDVPLMAELTAACAVV